MVPSVRPETVVFAALVAFVGWWQVDLPPAERAVVVAAGVLVFAAASHLLERWRRAYLAGHLDDE